ncbi:MAG: hypothetical protein AAB489_00195 [Patescibacteria group bacterium]
MNLQKNDWKSSRNGGWQWAGLRLRGSKTPHQSLRSDAGHRQPQSCPVGRSLGEG